MLYRAIKHLFPGIANGEFSLQDDGAGPYIARWSRPEPKPTPEQLAAVVIPTPEQIQADYTARIQVRLDAFARTRGYDGILSAASYVTSTNAQFAKEGQYCVGARDSTWAKGYEVMAAVQAGTRPMPTWAELEAELPALAWPA